MIIILPNIKTNCLKKSLDQSIDFYTKGCKAK